jgi:hypothetical protein
MFLDGFFWVLVILVATHLGVVGYLIRRGRSLEARSRATGLRSTHATPSASGRSPRHGQE